MNRLIAGMSGWGKSYHTQAIVEASLPNYEIAAVLDYKDEYRGLVKSGYAKHLIVGPAEADFSVGEWRQVFEENPKLVLARHKIDATEWMEVAARIIAAIRSMSGPSTPSLTAIEEAHFVAPQRGSIPDPITGLATTGRGEGASSLWSTQRLAKLDETIIAQAQERLFGGFMSDADLNKVEGVVEYPKELHNPQTGRVAGLPEDLLDGDGDPSSLSRYEDSDGNMAGSEWVYSNDKGERERRSTRGLEMESTHFGPEGVPLYDPDYQ